MQSAKLNIKNAGVQALLFDFAFLIFIER